jgi:hypothetical protein
VATIGVAAGNGQAVVCVLGDGTYGTSIPRHQGVECAI